ncbi:hypothetical protein ACLBWX_18380 [Methylobacterium sp. M6A4_1b]
MFTLLMLIIAVGAIAASAYAAAQRPIPIVEALPVGALGLTWRRLGERRTGYGPKMLWIADAGDEAYYSLLYRTAKDDMRALGFGWGGETYGSYDRPVCWEPIPEPTDAHYEDGIYRAENKSRIEVDRRDAEEFERRRRVEAAEVKRRAQAEQEREERIAAVETLRLRMKELPWAWTRSQRDRASEVLAERDEIPSEWAAKAAKRLVETCDDMVRRVTLRAQTERREEWWVRAADPAIQAEVHEATKILSSRDEDWATIDNDSGWSKAHTNLGHILAGMPSLAQCEASQALWAVWAHRRQIPTAMRSALFGEAK